MKKFIFALLLSIFIIPNVNAEVASTTQEYANYVYNANEEIIIDMYNAMMETYKQYQQENPYCHVYSPF